MIGRSGCARGGAPGSPIEVGRSDGQSGRQDPGDGDTSWRKFMQLTGRPLLGSPDAPPAARRSSLSSVAYASAGLIVIVVIGAVALFERGAGRADAPINTACEPWDSVASDAVARLVADSSDTAARQLGDAVFRLRRARKNCRLGWVSLACQDYLAGTPGVALASECFSAVVAGAR